MLVHEALIQLMIDANVDTIFTYMAEDNMDMVSEMEDNWNDNLEVIHSRHEQGSIAMADGYARATSNIGVSLVGRGPGIAQTGTALVTARKNNSKLLVLVPEPPTSSVDDPKEFEQKSFLNSTIGKVISIRSSNSAIDYFKRALRYVKTGEQPVAVQIPYDIINMKFSPDESLNFSHIPDELSSSKSYMEPDQNQISDAVDLYLDSDATVPPVIIAGRGAVRSDAKKVIEAVAKKMNALLVTTVQARGYFSDHPYSLGFIGSLGNNIANQYTIDSDYVLAVGCTLNQHTTDNGNIISDSTKVAQIDINGHHLDRFTPVDVGIIGDSRTTLEYYLEELRELDIDRTGAFWGDRLRKRVDNEAPFREDVSEQPGVIDPRTLITRLDEILPSDRLLTHDAGHFLYWVIDGISVAHPDDYIWTPDFAAVGQGTPISIGAALATNERTCVTFCGDAGFLMSVQEVETAARYGIPIIIIVINDGALGAEYHNLSQMNQYADPALQKAPNLSGVAEKLGAEGHTIKSISDFEAIKGTIGTRPDGPIVIDCKVDSKIKHPRF